LRLQVHAGAMPHLRSRVQNQQRTRRRHREGSWEAAAPGCAGKYRPTGFERTIRACRSRETTRTKIDVGKRKNHIAGHLLEHLQRLGKSKRLNDRLMEPSTLKNPCTDILSEMGIFCQYRRIVACIKEMSFRLLRPCSSAVVIE
jgi:hypothetical protein